MGKKEGISTGRDLIHLPISHLWAFEGNFIFPLRFWHIFACGYTHMGASDHGELVHFGVVSFLHNLHWFSRGCGVN
jgi:hypothetical protein